MFLWQEVLLCLTVSIKLTKIKVMIMNTRPQSITIISWYFIVAALVTAIGTPLMANNPQVKELMDVNALSIPMQYTLTALGSLASLIAGIVMLKGKGWGRFLFVISSVILYIINFVSTPASLQNLLIPGVAVTVIISFFLFTQTANEYFNPKKEAVEE